MAERRMFSGAVTESDLFLDMPATAQVLYFMLGMKGDDDGFVSSPKAIVRMCGAKTEDLSELEKRGFVIIFDSGVVLIRHWRVNNQIRSDRYRPSSCKEKALVTCGDDLVYQLSTNGETDGIRMVGSPDTQDRIGKDSIGEDSIGEDSTGKYSSDEESGGKESTETACAGSVNKNNASYDYSSVTEQFNSICTSLPKIRRLDDKRKKQIRSAGREIGGDFAALFRRVEDSDFLTGRSGNWNGCSFDWIMKPQNLIKILEGNYDNKAPAGKSSGSGLSFDINEFFGSDFSDEA